MSSTIYRFQIEQFKGQLIQLLDRTNDKNEEFHKTVVADFLKETYYKSWHYINIKWLTDLVIHNGSQAEIEELIFRLDGLTEEEIEIVEGE